MSVTNTPKRQVTRRNHHFNIVCRQHFKVFHLVNAFPTYSTIAQLAKTLRKLDQQISSAQSLHTSSNLTILMISQKLYTPPRFILISHSKIIRQPSSSSLLRTFLSGCTRHSLLRKLLHIRLCHRLRKPILPRIPCISPFRMQITSTPVVKAASAFLIFREMVTGRSRGSLRRLLDEV